MWLFVVYVILAFFIGYKSLTLLIPRFVLVPPQHWQDKIQKVLDHDTPIYLKVGNKKLAFRRRLILALNQPAFYTNYVNNKLKILPLDIQDPEYMERMKLRAILDNNRPILYGFFHPYANNGGGGERVLWAAVKATLTAKETNIVAIYTTNIEAEPKDILKKVEEKFQITGLDGKRIVFVYLRKFSNLIDANYWKHFTMAGQFFGTALLTLEALYQLSPDVWIDTQGLPASYFIVSLSLKIPILSYVHYPVLQSQMFDKLKFRKVADLVKFNKVSDIKQVVKFFYWLSLYYFYLFLGGLVSIVLTNSTWTYNHIKNIWKFNKEVAILYPPCGDFDHPTSSDKNGIRENKMLYIAQFRPEKRHDLLLEQYAKFLNDNKKVPTKKIPGLVFLGSCRTPEDTATLEAVKTRAQELELDVEFVVDCSYEELLEWLAKCTYGLNAMWNEHFGIGVVEYLANGLIPLVHASAGPLLDIVTGYSEEVEVEEEKKTKTSKNWYNNTGFFFKDSSDPDFKGQIDESTGFLEFEDASYPTFSQVLEQIVVKTPELVSDANLAAMRENGQKLVSKFSNLEFMNIWMNVVNRAEILERHMREQRDNVEKVY